MGNSLLLVEKKRSIMENELTQDEWSQLKKVVAFKYIIIFFINGY
jgi:hypothetical protein